MTTIISPSHLGMRRRDNARGRKQVAIGADGNVVEPGVVAAQEQSRLADSGPPDFDLARDGPVLDRDVAATR